VVEGGVLRSRGVVVVVVAVVVVETIVIHGIWSEGRGVTSSSELPYRNRGVSSQEATGRPRASSDDGRGVVSGVAVRETRRAGPKERTGYIAHRTQAASEQQGSARAVDRCGKVDFGYIRH
jgi:FtsZ-interacting cell division protein ZipA